MKKKLPEYYTSAWVQMDIYCALTAEDGAILDMIAQLKNSGGTLEDLERKVWRRQAAYRTELILLKGQIEKEIIESKKPKSDTSVLDRVGDFVRGLFSGMGVLIDTHPIACACACVGVLGCCCTSFCRWLRCCKRWACSSSG
jgi:hypothetical protein